MDSFAVNSSALNNGGVIASIVYLPSSTVTMDTLLFERSVGFMKGDTGMAYSLLGSISGVSFFGNTAVTNGFEVVGDLTKYGRIYIEAANTTFGFNGTGDLRTVALGMPGTTVSEYALTGTLNRTQVFSGSNEIASELIGTLHNTKQLGNSSITISLSPTGSLLYSGGLHGTISSALDISSNLGNQVSLFGSSISTLGLAGNLTKGVVSYIPTANVTSSLVLAGQIKLLIRLRGDIQSDWINTARLSNKHYLSGAIYIATDLYSDLASNASGQDLAALLMIRPAINREMTR